MYGNKKKDLNKKLFPLKRFSKVGLYNLTYLSLLVQRGKLKAEKVGRNYFTNIEWFEDYLVNHSRDKNKKFDKNLILNKSTNLVSKNNNIESLSKGEVNGLNEFLNVVLKEDDVLKQATSQGNKDPIIIPKIKGSNIQAEKNLKIIKRRNNIFYKFFKYFKKSVINLKKRFFYVVSKTFNFLREFVKTFVKYCFNLIKLLIALPFMLVGSFLFLLVGIIIGAVYQISRKIYGIPGKILLYLNLI
jgi:hypothetical protein